MYNVIVIISSLLFTLTSISVLLLSGDVETNLVPDHRSSLVGSMGKHVQTTEDLNLALCVNPVTNGTMPSVHLFSQSLGDQNCLGSAVNVAYKSFIQPF